jgi:hypothetical protein
LGFTGRETHPILQRVHPSSQQIHKQRKQWKI